MSKENEHVLSLLNGYGFNTVECKNMNVYLANKNGNIIIIDDGKVQCLDALYHVYISERDGKIFEGRIETIDELKVVMKVLGFENE